jgi:hypothetical protein
MRGPVHPLKPSPAAPAADVPASPNSRRRVRFSVTGLASGSVQRPGAIPGSSCLLAHTGGRTNGQPRRRTAVSLPQRGCTGCESQRSAGQTVPAAGGAERWQEGARRPLRLAAERSCIQKVQRASPCILTAFRENFGVQVLDYWFYVDRRWVFDLRAEQSRRGQALPASTAAVCQSGRLSALTIPPWPRTANATVGASCWLSGLHI